MYGFQKHSALSFKRDQGMPAAKSHQLPGRFQAPVMLLNTGLGAFQSILNDGHSSCRQIATYKTIQLKRTDGISMLALTPSYWAVLLTQLLTEPNIRGTHNEELHIQTLELL